MTFKDDEIILKEARKNVHLIEEIMDQAIPKFKDEKAFRRALFIGICCAYRDLSQKMDESSFQNFLTNNPLFVCIFDEIRKMNILHDKVMNKIDEKLEKPKTTRKFKKIPAE